MPIVSVNTATIGRPELFRCLESVAKQTLKDYQHLLIVDGPEHAQKVQAILDDFGKSFLEARSKVDVCILPYAKKQWGGPIYSMAPVLCTGQFVVNLDDDNFLDPGHLRSCHNAYVANLPDKTDKWVFSLRKITTHGKFICNDNCESLGFLHPVWNTQNHHIDTSCFFLPRHIALELAPFWYSEQHGEVNDRLFYQELQKRYPNLICTAEYTVNYEVNPTGKIDVSFFHRGNKWMEEKYQTQTPWKKVTKPAVVFSCYGLNIDPRVVQMQKQVIEKFLPKEVDFKQVPAQIMKDNVLVPGIKPHAQMLDEFVQNTNYEVYVILDIDCIPLNAQVIERLIAKARVSGLVGCAQRACHIQNNGHIYVGPFALAFLKRFWQNVGSPSFVATPRGDVAEEFTYKAEAVNSEPEFIMPTSVIESKWELEPGKPFGIGTTYERMFFHTFEIAGTGAEGNVNQKRNVEIFLSKCKEVLESKEN